MRFSVFIFLLTFITEKSAALALSEPASTTASSSAASAHTNPATGVLRGVVYEAGTRERIANANVRIETENFSTESESNERGEFQLENVPAGLVKVIVTALKYKRLRIKQRIESDVEITVALYLRREATDPYETVVRGKKRRERNLKTSALA